MPFGEDAIIKAPTDIVLIERVGHTVKAILSYGAKLFLASSFQA